MKIAIASSGLGHVARGVETWARDSAWALGSAGRACETEDYRLKTRLRPTSGVVARLCRDKTPWQAVDSTTGQKIGGVDGGGQIPKYPNTQGPNGEGMGYEKGRGGFTPPKIGGVNPPLPGENIEVVLFSGAAVPGLRPTGNRLQTEDYRLQTEDPTIYPPDCEAVGWTQQLACPEKLAERRRNNEQPSTRVLPCLKRGSTTARFLAKAMPGFTWRWGWTSTYGIEQFTFWRALRRELRRGAFDILHTQDALLAKLCNDDVRRGYWNGKVILAHGTEEPPEFLAQFQYVQHLTPWHLEEMRKSLLQRDAEVTKKHREEYFGQNEQNIQNGGPSHATGQGADSCVNTQASGRATDRGGRIDFAIPNFVDTDLFCPSEQIDRRPQYQSRDTRAKLGTRQAPTRYGAQLQTADCRQGEGDGGEGEKTPKNLSSRLRSCRMDPSTQISYRQPTTEQLRSAFGVPPDAFVIGCVAAVKKGHKRIDYLIREFAALEKSLTEVTKGTKSGEGDCFTPGPPHPSRKASIRRSFRAMEDKTEGTAGPRAPEGAEVRGEAAQSFPGMENPGRAAGEEGRGGFIPPKIGRVNLPLPNSVYGLRSNVYGPGSLNIFLLISGAKTDESDELVKMAEELAPGRVKLLFDLGRERMPDVYKAMDVFVLPSLFEMMPIAILEAMSSGLPVVHHDHAVMNWMTGEGGLHADLDREGALARELSNLLADNLQRARIGANARAMAEKTFSKEAVVPQMIEMYHRVLKDGRE